MPLCTLHALPYRPDPAFWFERIRHAPGAVLLDSGRPIAERGRFDLLSAWPIQVLEPSASETGVGFFSRLREAL
ncbi:MAG TPA: aminodeoxychorismate synthase component I, partial [Pseudomonas sp.]|nr:aminodeoxychorismate synthase component I [Pseudomonas sp.]